MGEMGAAWVAGAVRARAIGRRRLGAVAARELAFSPRVADAVDALSRSPYGRYVRPGNSVAEAQRAVAETVLWNIRVLAGWLPARGAQMLRVLAGWFEIANVDERLAEWAGRAATPPFRMGSMATAWQRLADTTSPLELRAALAGSAWGDPGAASPRDIALGMRLSWARRVAALAEPAPRWAAGAVALLVAREKFARAASLTERARAEIDHLLGRDWALAASVTEFAGRVRAPGRGALSGTQAATDLWRAEARWWARLHADAVGMLAGAGAGAGFGPGPAVGAVALLATDAWQVCAALEVAARGGGPLEVVDDLA